MTKKKESHCWFNMPGIELPPTFPAMRLTDQQKLRGTTGERPVDEQQLDIPSARLAWLQSCTRKFAFGTVPHQAKVKPLT